MRRFQKRNGHLDLDQEVVKKSVGTSIESPGYDSFQGGDDGRGYRNMCEIARGSKWDLGH